MVTRLYRRKALIVSVALLAAVSFSFHGVGAGRGGLDLLSEQQELFADALGDIGLEAEDVRIDTRDLALWGGQKYTLPLLEVYMDNPWKISSYTRTQSQQLLDRADRPSVVLILAHKQLGAAVRLGLIGDPLEEYAAEAVEAKATALGAAIAALNSTVGMSFSPADAQLTEIELPLEVQTELAVFIHAAAKAGQYRERALVAPLHASGIQLDAARDTVLEHLLADEETSVEQCRSIELLIETVDWPQLNAGAVLLAYAVARLERYLADAEAVLPADAVVHIPTAFGPVVLDNSDSQEPATDPAACLLYVNLSGDTWYQDEAGRNRYGIPLNVVIDLAGDDTYETAGGCNAWGAGIFGYSLLVDSAGRDVYHGGELCFGAGLVGTGMLWDKAGADRYLAESMAQAAGMFGTGVLIDASGDDEYAIRTYGQGYGYTMGCGLLLDPVGNDRYIGLEEPGYENGGPFGEERFIHFVQGAGYGRRADYSDGHSWSGGIGMLVDGAGDDEYECEVYGQGTGYWYALGMLVDKGGNDRHHAGWYSLGGSPHMAAGVFQDDGGDDWYALKQMQSLGNGRDFSVAWFEDAGGNDWYQGGIMTFGVGDINGIGVFWDKDGNDVYLGLGPCFGQSRIEHEGSLRDEMLTLGLFIDGGGDDDYRELDGDAHPTGIRRDVITEWESEPEHPAASNNAIWTRPTDQNEVPGALGVGLDRDAG